MSIGERLRRARLEQGLTLADLSDQTKVQHWILDAIERDDVARVPGGVFIRGYLMSFARAVGLDGDRIWADFRSELPSPTAEPAVVQQPSVPAIGPWTIVRVAAVVLVVAVVWRNIPRGNSDTVAPTPPPAEQRTSDVALAVVTTTIAAEPVAAAAVPEPPKIVVTPAAPAPVPAAVPARAVAAAREAVTEPIATADANTVDQATPPPAEDVGTNAPAESESPQEEPSASSSADTR